MDIVVCVKQVPKEFHVDLQGKRLIREGIKGEINPSDKNAIELALKFRQKHGGKVTLITMGPAQVEDSLLGGLAMGADEAVLLCDQKFADADTLATSYTLAGGIRKLGDFGLIICGNETADSGTGQVGIQIAEHLGLPQITNVTEAELIEGKLRVRRILEDECEIIAANPPVLITVLKGINEPRIPGYADIIGASKKPISRWNACDIGANDSRIGSKGSPIYMIDVFPIEATRQCQMLTGEADEIVAQLVSGLREKGILV